ncbi:larval cuticle protein A2B [Aethina tumida]|uniref:larval cuticle protein A2B n=1 Tax=Aethina tumida TaxID=116153 RepID=UPI00096AEBE0|nr:larval cuticle protein A2B [Aethina tumida]
MFKILLLSSFVGLVFCDVSHLVVEVSTEPPPPKPYAFGYAAGRFPGHIDRTHSEVSDGSGVVQGSYSYVDPRHQIRTVEYVADKNGFHPVLNKNPPPLPKDSAAVAQAKEKHLLQYAAIAASHQVQPNSVLVPVDSAAVQYAKNKHLSLFQKIAEEHARIAEERKALELAEEAQKNVLF